MSEIDPATAQSSTDDDQPGATSPSRQERRDYLKFFGAQSISVLGDEFGKLAVPLVAVLVLSAGEGGIGLIEFAQTLPYLLVTLPAGVLVDRIARRSALYWADTLRALLFAALAVLVLNDALSYPTLIGIVVAAGALDVVFELAQASATPEVVNSTLELLRVNVLLSLAEGFAVTFGPFVAGVLISEFGPESAFIFNAATFAISAVILRSLRTAALRKPANNEQPLSRSVFVSEAREGLKYVWTHPIIRPITVSTALSNLSFAIYAPMLLLFIVRDLEATPLALGIALSTGSIAYLAGSAITDIVVRRLGLGRAIGFSLLLNTVALVVVAAQPGLVGIALASLSWAASSILIPIYNSAHLTLLQSITPSDLMGRMNAGVRVVAHGAEPIGGLVGAAIGVMLGARITILIAVVIAVAAALPILRSSVMNIVGYDELTED